MARPLGLNPTADALRMRRLRQRKREAGDCNINVYLAAASLMPVLRARGIVSDDPKVVRAEARVILREIIAAATS